MENTTWIDIMLYVGYFLIAVAAIAAIVLPLIKSLDNPRSLLTMGAGLVGLVIIFLIAYALAGNEVLPAYAKQGVGETTSKLIGGTLITMYMLIIIAILSIAATEVSKLFR